MGNLSKHESNQKSLKLYIINALVNVHHNLKLLWYNYVPKFRFNIYPELENYINETLIQN